MVWRGETAGLLVWFCLGEGESSGLAVWHESGSGGVVGSASVPGSVWYHLNLLLLFNMGT